MKGTGERNGATGHGTRATPRDAALVASPRAVAEVPGRFVAAMGAVAAGAALVGACASGNARGADAATVECPAPVGSISKEDCATIGRDFSFEVSPSLSSPAPKGEHARAATLALQRASGVGASLHDARVALCEKHNACGIAPAAFAEAEGRLSEGLQSLIKLWDERRLADAASIAKFEAGVAEIAKAAGVEAPKTEASKSAAGEAPKAPEAVRVVGATLAAEASAPGLTVKKSGTSLVATSEGGAPGEIEVVRAKLANRGVASGRALVRVVGKFAPKEPLAFAGGDAITVRFEARGAAPTSVVVRLHSIEDDDLASRAGDKGEVEQVVAFPADGKLKHEVKLLAPADASGLYVSLAPVQPAKDKPVMFDSVEVRRGNAMVFEARGEKPEPWVATRCALSNKKPIEGKKSFACSNQDGLDLGAPRSYVSLAIGGGDGKAKSPIHLASLEGGRTLEVSVIETAEFIAALSGAGALTLERLDLVPRP